MAPSPDTSPTNLMRPTVEVVFLHDILPETPPPRPRHWPLIVLLIATAIGGIIRFSFLNKPCLWGDEAAVYRRICGTYAQLLEELRDAGFGPLHYELEWLVSRFLKPTPPILRLVPAICGTLMIPAMYFLARQLVSKSTAAIAAAITACSGFMIFYSRDAKMYSEVWLMVTLSAAGLLWWLRSGRSTAWLIWVAAGCAGCGIHASALALPCITPLLLLAQRRAHWMQSIIMAVGLALIVAGPLGYYSTFNQWIDNVNDRGWNASGIEWVELQNRNLSGPQLARYTATAYMMGWAWPTIDHEREIPPVMQKWPKLAAEILTGIFILGILPWRLLWPNSRPDDPNRERSWFVLIFLGLCIVAPAYAFYCHSMADFASPLDWFRAIADLLPPKQSTWMSHHIWVWYVIAMVIIEAIIILAYASVRRRPSIYSAIQSSFAISAVLGICWVVYAVCSKLSLDAMLAGNGWHSVWQPRYLGFIWPAFAIAMAALLMRLPTRPIRATAIAALLGVNLAFGLARIFVYTEPPTDQMASDTCLSQPNNAITRAYFDIQTDGPGPGQGTIMRSTGAYYLQMVAWRQPMDPDRFQSFVGEFQIPRGSSDEIINDAKSPNLKHLIVWTEFEPKSPIPADELIASLPGWRLAGQTIYPMYTFWDWQDITRFLRREYVRVK